MDTDVLVVGAGPAGLMAANLLARYGVAVRVIDADPGITTESRATTVATRTLELWDKLGLADGAVATGMRVDATRFWAGGKVLADVPMAGPGMLPTPFPYGLTYEQWRTVRMLTASLAAADRSVEVEWGTILVGLHQTTDAVQATVVRADGTESTIVARWGLGADGGRSTVRSLLGVPFEGETYDLVSFLADVDMESGFQVPENRLNIFVAPAGTTGIEPLHVSSRAGYRIFGTFTPGLRAALEAEQGGIQIADLQRWFDEQFLVPARILRCEWYTTFKLHRRIATRFRVGRWFLVGDSAHLHPPSGGQGANLSMGDGYNLGVKLGLVATGQAKPDLLDSYEPERRTIAMKVTSGSDKGIKLEASSPTWRRIREVVLPALLRVSGRIPPLAAEPVRLVTQQWVHYRSSPAVAGDTSGRKARPGDRAPDAVLYEGAQTHRLFARLRGVGHHLLLLEGREPARGFAESAAEATALARRYRVAIEVHVIGQGNDDFHAAYRVSEPTLVLVRPDGHIGYRASLGHLAQFARYLDRWYLRCPDPAESAATTPIPAGSTNTQLEGTA